jgi:cAMP-dependent protein kinase regulator
MKPKKAVKELERQLRKDPGNLVLRLRLASALRTAGRTDEAVTLYRSVAVVYHSDGRLAQAIAVCKSVLEIDPAQRETQALLAELEHILRAQAPPPGPELAEVGALAPPLPPTDEAAPAPAVPARQPAPPAARTRRPTAPPGEAAPGSTLAGHLPAPNRPARSRTAPPTGRHAEVGSGGPPPRPPVPPPRPPVPPRAEFNVRSGLTPLAENDPLPSLADATKSKSDPVIAGDSRPPGVPTRRSRGRAAVLPPEPDAWSAGEPDRRSQAPLLTPTPLPPPLAPHEAEPTGVATQRAQHRQTGEGAVDEPPGTPPPAEAVWNQVDDDAPTTIAPAAGWTPPPEPRRALPLSPMPEPEREPARGEAPVFDEATRLGDSLAVVGPAAFRGGGAALPPIAPESDFASVEVEDRPTDPRAQVGTPARARARGLADRGRDTNPAIALPGPVAQRGSGVGRDRRPTYPDLPAKRKTRPLGGGVPPSLRDDAAADLSLEDDEVTETSREDGGSPQPDTSDRTRADDDLPSLRPGRRAIAPSEDEDRRIDMPRVFGRSYSETLQGLAPDGSAIDAPLSFFGELPEDALAELVRRMSLRGFEAGEVILHEGDPGDACYVIAAGSVRVLKRDPARAEADLIEVARLGAGAVFGEFALLADRRRHATVQAVEDCELYEISRRLLRELAATFAEVGPALERFYRERLLSTLLVTAPFFGPLEEERRGELLARFRPTRCEAGERIVEEGKAAGGLYLIVLGSVDITKRIADGRSVVLTTLGEGAYFGELSLLRGGVARATVTASGPTELAMLPPEDFYEVVAANPVLWEEMRREARRRELMLNQIVTGETSVV